MAGLGLPMLFGGVAALGDDIARMTKTEAGKSTSVLDDAATQTRVAMPKMAGLPAGVYGAMRASGWGDPASGMRRKQKPRSVKAAGLFCCRQHAAKHAVFGTCSVSWMSTSGYCIGRGGLAYTSKRPL